MEPPLLAMPNLASAPQIFGSLYARLGYARAFFAGHLCGSIPRNNDYSLFNLADGVGFEPTDAFTSAVFKTAALGRSATRPLGFGTWLPLGGIEPLSPLASRGLLPFMSRSLADYLRQSLKLGGHLVASPAYWASFAAFRFPYCASIPPGWCPPSGFSFRRAMPRRVRLPRSS